MPLQGYATLGDFTPEAAKDAGQFLPSSNTEARSILFSGGPSGGLTDHIGRSAGHWLDEAGQALQGGDQAITRGLTADEANARYGIDGALKFDKPVSESEALFKYQNKRDELYRSTVLSRADGVNGAEKFAYSLAGGIVDPVSVGIGLIPIAGEARFGALVADAGLAGRLAKGAWAGGQGAVAQETLTYGLSQYEGLDYTPEDAAMGILAGTVFGAGVDGAAYGLSRGLSPSGAQRVATGTEAIVEARLRAGGLSDAQVRGVMAGIHAESGFDAAAVNPTSKALGLGQWLGPRKAALIERYGPNPTAEQQADFLLWELQGGDHGGRSVLAGQTEADVARAYITDFMRPAAGRETQGDLSRASAYLGGEIGPAPATAHSAEGVYTAPPKFVSAMDEIDAAGTTAKAIGDLAEDGRVDVGDLVAEAIDNPRARPYLSEETADLTFPARAYDDAVAVTKRGTEIPVKYVIADLRDVVASHDGDLIANPHYPQDLQPRARDRAGSQANLLETEKNFNPKLLMRDVTASGGAPILSPDGVVESGNGRSILLRRNAERGTDIYDRYKAELKAQGFDISGVEYPALFRVRTNALEGPARVRLSREMNEDALERLSVTEQAVVDAEALRPEEVGLYAGGPITHKANDKFTQAFIARAAPGSMNEMIDPKTLRLSQKGEGRIQAALVAKAYGSRDLVSAIFDTSNPNMKTFGDALTQVAPVWAKMRGLADAGELAAGADTTGYLVEAMNFVRHVRDNRLNMADLIEKWADQVDMFAGDALSPEAHEYLRLMFRDESFRVQRSAEAIAADLKDMAEAAMESTGAPNLFGSVDSFDVNAQIQRLRSRAGLEETANVGSQRFTSDRASGDGFGPGADRGAPEEDLPGLVGLASPGERAPSGQAGGRSQPESAGTGVTPSALDALDDPEINLLREEIARLEATDADALKGGSAFDDAEKVAHAIEAYTACLIKGGE